MKLFITIVNDEDAGNLLKKLLDSDFGVTKLASTGGFLKSGNTTLLIGTDDSRRDELFGIIKSSCKVRKEMTTTSAMIGENAVMGMPIEITVGGATIFVVNVEEHIKF